ncbi:MAG: type I secretion system permease/ATPase, partial [Arcobacteraceae bacterium]|nr:type I secretion system permease/ATPase [Arcobacteraceae bacterium]
ARAIYNDPVLVVLDEPNSNLDEQGELALVEAIKILKEKKSTVIIITHRPNILQVTNKLALVKNGLLELYGQTDQVLAKLATLNHGLNGQEKAQTTSLSKLSS